MIILMNETVRRIGMHWRTPVKAAN